MNIFTSALGTIGHQTTDFDKLFCIAYMPNSNHHMSTKSFKSVVRPGHGPEVWWGSRVNVGWGGGGWRRQASEGAEKDGRAWGGVADPL
eukprot:COSAG02_NODE_6834_length_3337_cov_28.082149_1_plen_89_part_00